MTESEETGWRDELGTVFHAFGTPGTNAHFLVYTVITTLISVMGATGLSVDVSGSNNFNALWLLLFIPPLTTLFAFLYRPYANWCLSRKERARAASPSE